MANELSYFLSTLSVPELGCFIVAACEEILSIR